MFDIDTTAIPPNRLYLQKARENYLCAKKAVEKGWHNAAVSRAYYAMFLAAVEYMDICGQRPVKPHLISGGWNKRELAEQVGKYSRRVPLESYLTGGKKLREIADYETAILSAKQARQECLNAHEFLSFAVEKAINGRN